MDCKHITELRAMTRRDADSMYILRRFNTYEDPLVTEPGATAEPDNPMRTGIKEDGIVIIPILHD